MTAGSIQLILIVSGVATMGAILQCLAPRAALELLYGVEEFEPVTLLLARHWGLLIFSIGALLVYSAYDPATRDPILVVASLEKIVFAGLVFFGPARRTRFATFAAAGDTAFVALYLLYFTGL